MIHFPERRDVYLRNVNTRMEKHGNEDRLAMDLAIAVTGPNTLLDMIHPDLRAALFTSAAPGAADQTDLPNLRFPRIKCPIDFDIEHAGMSLIVHYGANGKGDMAMGAVKLSKVQIEKLIEGGSVELRFNASTLDVSEKVIGKLALLQKHTIEITLNPPERDETESPREKAKREAEDLFNGASNPAPDEPQQTPEEAFAGTAGE